MQTDIVLRFMSGKELDAFAEEYHDAKLKHSYRQPTQEQMKIAAYAKKHGIHAAAEKFKKTFPQTDYAVKRVASWNFMNDVR